MTYFGTYPSAGADKEPGFEVRDPAGPLASVVLSSPHSGSRYPACFLEQTRLDPLILRRSEDTFVDELFDAAPSMGAPLLRALLPRALVDLNREPYELDPRMFEGRLPSFANTRSLRVAGGLGTVPRVVGEAQEIYDRRLPIGEAIERIEQIYKPYHRALRRLLLRTQRVHGTAILLDCHSMPSRGTAREDRPRADIVLGDRYGASCAPVLTDAVEGVLRELGYSVSRNRPYAGGYITEHYGAPVGGLHALQIEVNRALYMDEATFTRSAGFTKMSADLARVVAAVIGVERDALASLPAAAE